MNFWKKNYKSISIVFFGLAIYVILFPFVSKVLTTIFPTLGICPYLAMTGKPCPLCGGTRYIANLGRVWKDPTYLCHPFGIMMLFILFELVFRVVCFVWIKKQKKLDTMILFDVIVHLLVFVTFLTYEIIFLRTN